MVKAGRRSDKRWFYIVLGLLLVGGIGTLSYMSTRGNQSISQMDTTLAPIVNEGHVAGSDSAPLEVVEFGDYECPACGSFATLSEPDVRARLVNTGKIRFRFMDFPLSGHRNTLSGHRAAWCAGDQGRFWEMHDALYQNQDRWSGEATTRPDRVINGLAQQLGVNMDQYESCVKTGKFDPQIRANLQEGITRGVGSTPTFFIGNKKVATAIPYDAFKKYVDEALSTAPVSKTAGVKSPRLDVPKENSKSRP